MPFILIQGFMSYYSKVFMLFWLLSTLHLKPKMDEKKLEMC